MVRATPTQLVGLALTVALAAATGCQPPSATGPTGGGDRAGAVSAKRAGRTATPGGAKSGGGSAIVPKGDEKAAGGTQAGGQAGGTSAGGSSALAPGGGLLVGPGLGLALDTPPPTRVVSTAGETAQLIGKVKLISDKGNGIVSNNAAGLIGNNSGGLVSDGGSGLISNNGGGLVSDGGSGLIGKTKWALLQAIGAPTEAALADAWVEVFDAAGNRLVGPDGKPIVARTDANGQYALTTPLPNENLVLRIRLADDVAAGGELRAFLTRDGRSAGGPSAVDIDTASTLGSAYVLEKYVKGKQDVYERLPGAEDAALHRDLDAARGRLAGPPTYKAADLVQAVEGLRGQDTALDATLVRIEKLLTLGQANLGAGLPANTVALAYPVAVAGTAAGGFFVGEAVLGRVREVDGQGAIHTLVAPDGGLIADAFAAIDDMAVGPDGLLYVVEPKSRRIRRIGPTNTLEVVAGNAGLPRVQDGTQEANGLMAVDAALNPSCLAFGPDGTLYLAESGTVEGEAVGTPGRIYERLRDGTLRRIGNGEAAWTDGATRGLAVTADGTLWAAVGKRPDAPDQLGSLLRKRPGGTWEQVATGLQLGAQAALAAAPDGGVWLSEDKGHRLSKVGADGARQTVAGTGQAGFAGDGGAAAAASLNQPAGLWRAADGTLYVADYGNGCVRAIEGGRADGVIRTVAGITGASQTGDASRLSLNAPTGVALDAAGQLLFSENGGNTIKRYDGSALQLVAGTERGFAGDGGPALAARLAEPTGIAFTGGALYIGDHGNHRVRRVAADGTISTAAGLGKDTTPLLTTSPSDPNVNVGAASAMAVSPEGLVYFSSMTHHRVLRLNASGQVEVVAGALSTGAGNPAPDDGGDGGPATAAKFSTPVGLAFDPAGNLFIADLFNLRVRKVDRAGTITTVAGTSRETSLAVLLGGEVPIADGSPATAQTLALPVALAVGPDGSLYVGELGTKQLGAIGIFPAAPQMALIPKTIPARIRKIAPDGSMTVLAGPGGKFLNGTDGEDPLGLPMGLLVDRQGRLVIADAANNQVRIIPAGSF